MTENNYVSFLYEDKRNSMKFVVKDEEIIKKIIYIQEMKDIMEDIKNESEIIIPLSKYKFETTNNLYKFLEKDYFINISYEDLELARFLGYREYVIFVLSRLNNLKWSYAEAILDFRLLTLYPKQFLKYIGKIAQLNEQFKIVISEIYNKKVSFKNEKTNDRFSQLLSKLVPDDIIYLVKNFYFQEHILGTFIFIKLLERGLKICKERIPEFMFSYKRGKQIFCKNVYCALNVSQNKSLDLAVSFICFEEENEISYCYSEKNLYKNPDYLSFEGGVINRMPAFIPDPKRKPGMKEPDRNTMEKNTHEIYIYERFFKINTCVKCKRMQR